MAMTFILLIFAIDGTITDVVARDLDLHFEGQQFEILIYMSGVVNASATMPNVDANMC